MHGTVLLIILLVFFLLSSRRDIKQASVMSIQPSSGFPPIVGNSIYGVLGMTDLRF